MPELIDRAETLQKLCAECYNRGSFVCSSCVIPHIIKDIPTSDAEPVRHGRWRFEKGDNKTTCDGWICTACNYGFHTKVPYFEVFNFCPMCGAKMDGGADNG